MSQLKSRNIAVAIILSIVTCGIYGLYWLYCLARDVNEASNHRNDTSAGMVLLLCIVTCGIYQWYWMYRTGVKLDEIAVNNGRVAQNRAILLLLLSVFGLGIVSYAIIQSELNDYADGNADGVNGEI